MSEQNSNIEALVQELTNYKKTQEDVEKRNKCFYEVSN